MIDSRQLKSDLRLENTTHIAQMEVSEQMTVVFGGILEEHLTLNAARLEKN